MYGLTLITILVIMGGAIAYIGDKLGTKIGKKKLTIFGLRPKHTSILVTIITGFLIAASTLGVMTLASKDVRTALFGMEALKEELSSLTQEVFQRTNELTVSRAALDAKNKEYTALSQKVQETAGKLAGISEELRQVTAERDRVSLALASVQKDYTAARADLKKSQADIAALQKTKNQLDERVAGLNEAKNGLEKDVQRLTELTNNLKKGIQTVRGGSIIFRAGEALSANAVKGGRTKAETEQAITAVIIKTNHAVLERMGIEDPKTEALWIAQADFDEVVKLLENNPQDFVIRIVAAGNTVYGEPVMGQIELFPNHLIYPQGKTIYSETLNASTDVRQAEEAVLNFLQKVNAQAVRQGVLPDPIQGTVGVIRGSQLFDTVNQVKQFRGNVEIAAVTAGDIYTLGPLRITIQVKSAQ